VPLTGVLALADGAAAVVLLLSVPRQRRNKVGVIAVASVLLGISGWLAVLALTPNDAPPSPTPVVTGGPTA
jgi:hypothetical protein